MTAKRVEILNTETQNENIIVIYGLTPDVTDLLTNHDEFKFRSHFLLLNLIISPQFPRLDPFLLHCSSFRFQLPKNVGPNCAAAAMFSQDGGHSRAHLEASGSPWGSRQFIAEPI